MDLERHRRKIRQGLLNAKATAEEISMLWIAWTILHRGKCCCGFASSATCSL